MRVWIFKTIEQRTCEHIFRQSNCWTTSAKPRLHCDGPNETQQQLEEHDIGAFCDSSTKKPSLATFMRQDIFIYVFFFKKKTTEISYEMVLRLLAVSREHASFRKETGTLEVRCDKMNRTNPRVRNAAGHSTSTKTCFTLIVSCALVHCGITLMDFTTI